MKTRRFKHTRKESGNRDIFFMPTVLLLIVSMVMATVFHLHYSSVDEQAVPGSMTLSISATTGLTTDSDSDAESSTIYSVTINSDMRATIDYLGLKLRGWFKLVGGDADTLMYLLKGVELAEEPASEVAKAMGAKEGGALDTSGIKVYIRMPRSGLQGDWVGIWVVDYRYIPTSVQFGDWCIVREDGTALAGSERGGDTVQTLKELLEAKSASYTWTRRGDDLELLEQ